MSGFKNFLLRGSLVDTAVAFIVGTSFAAVTTAFTDMLMSWIPGSGGADFGSSPEGKFVSAVVAFVILAAVVYFFIVTPYTKLKERYFPSPEPGPDPQITLLTEIRDQLAAK